MQADLIGQFELGNEALQTGSLRAVAEDVEGRTRSLEAHQVRRAYQHVERLLGGQSTRRDDAGRLERDRESLRHPGLRRSIDRRIRQGGDRRLPCP